ncbi:hypothetical protein ebA5971 [Aromatoleum aromaticum EbN1]|uniref:Uncharacterized protein n=1 Tax=Aromatoleum aromaticum (strain DSM 19018 / LMG 30748 / EbN1) TaxID=76114 RepID=Q5NZI3_AROAE|nr:hypothetical protein ebA5971 [Aromatoleum aromaticum EbN1]
MERAGRQRQGGAEEALAEATGVTPPARGRTSWRSARLLQDQAAQAGLSVGLPSRR